VVPLSFVDDAGHAAAAAAAVAADRYHR